MRSIPIAPAAMQTYSIAWDSFNSHVESVDMRFNGSYEIRIGQVPIVHGPIHCQIRSVNLQNQASPMDSKIFIPHFSCDGPQVCFSRRVVSIHHGRRDYAWRRGGHENFLESVQGFYVLN